MSNVVGGSPISFILACPLTKQNFHVHHEHVCFAAQFWFVFSLVFVSHAHGKAVEVVGLSFGPDAMRYTDIHVEESTDFDLLTF